MSRNGLTPAQARAMDKCRLVPLGLTYEHAHGIVVVHQQKGNCTPATCARLAAALERIRVEEEAR
ncbi:hypothetical protein ACIBG0_39120 [Nocardia sp. NPDC050630]|uniref:hypothetical protein n=1 Tax=Nocardia sp. NPDC050630 TaxID=3364321 RepID=UPI0037B2A97E